MMPDQAACFFPNSFLKNVGTAIPAATMIFPRFRNFDSS